MPFGMRGIIGLNAVRCWETCLRSKLKTYPHISQEHTDTREVKSHWRAVCTQGHRKDNGTKSFDERIREFNSTKKKHVWPCLLAYIIM